MPSRSPVQVRLCCLYSVPVAASSRAALTALRKRLGLSQAEFARQFMFNLRTLQDWEQGRREPERIARTYLRVIERNPDAVRTAREDQTQPTWRPAR